MLFEVAILCYKRSDFTKPAYKTAEIIEMLNISYSIIKNYDKQCKLHIQKQKQVDELY